MNILTKTFITLSSLIFVGATYADVKVNMYETEAKGQGTAVGFIEIKESPKGLVFTPHLHNVTPGPHGFHLHQNASCADNGMAAGGHFDPNMTSKHLGPYGNGHLGDLPVLVVAADGTANTPVVALHLHDLKQVNHLALMLHAGGDNYSDTPSPLGGGGSRMVCGVISE